MSAPPRAKPVVHLVVCGCPVAGQVGRMVDLVQKAGWTACVVATPDGGKFIDAATLSRQTGHPVRTTYKKPGEPDFLPPSDAVVAAPVSVNTVNKWAAGICDTLALGLLVEAIGLGQPIVAVPYTNRAHAAHPAFRENLARLRSWGVDVLFGDDVLRLHEPRTGNDQAPFPWDLVMARLTAAHTGRPVRVTDFTLMNSDGK